MTAETTSPQDLGAYQEKVKTNRLGLWLFLLSDAFVFGGLLISRFYLMGTTRPHLEQTLGLIVTSVLLLSSYFMNRADRAAARGDRKALNRNTLITIVLGLIFMVGVLGFEWRLAPFGPADNVQGAIFYMLTGMHAFHVLTGLVFLGFVYRNSRKGLYSREKHWQVEAAAIYWHFIDVVWIFYYPALYLIGTPAG